MTSSSWSVEQLPDLTGKTAVITGANSGLGYYTARALATKGAHVVLACRSVDKGHATADDIRAELPRASLELLELDLSALRSVRAASEKLQREHSRIDILCNNAGVMALPRHTTEDGFEMQFGTNHLGHFALTGLVLDRILAAPAGRVVTVTSGFHHMGRMRFDDPQGERSYSRWGAYAMSKLANLLFTLELKRRLERAGARALSVAAHPGYAATNLQVRGPQMDRSAVAERVARFFNKRVAQAPEQGAEPQIHACAAPDVRNGDFFGPDGTLEMKGHPKRVPPNPRARDEASMERLWALSEELTGVRYDALATPRAA